MENAATYSLADIASIVGKNDGFLGGGGIEFLALIFFIAVMNGSFGNWGNNATASTITNDFLYTNLASQNRDLGQTINNGFNSATQQNFDIQKDVLNQTNTINQTLCAGFNGVNSNIASLASQMAQQCCDLKTTMHAEGEATRALITENTIQSLRDQLSEKQSTLAQANLTLANAAQTQNILNALGTYVPTNNNCSCGY